MYQTINNLINVPHKQNVSSKNVVIIEYIEDNTEKDKKSNDVTNVNSIIFTKRKGCEIIENKKKTVIVIDSILCVCYITYTNKYAQHGARTSRLRV